jgi:U2-associated protein SR140
MGAGALKGLVGFVSFMRREDAEYAMQHADGAKWESNGATLSTSWGKGMPKPARALYRTLQSQHRCVTWQLTR